MPNDLDEDLIKNVMKILPGLETPTAEKQSGDKDVARLKKTATPDERPRGARSKAR